MHARCKRVLDTIGTCGRLLDYTVAACNCMRCAHAAKDSSFSMAVGREFRSRMTWRAMYWAESFVLFFLLPFSQIYAWISQSLFNNSISHLKRLSCSRRTAGEPDMAAAHQLHQRCLVHPQNAFKAVRPSNGRLIHSTLVVCSAEER